MRNYNHYLRFVRNGVKVKCLEIKYKDDKLGFISYNTAGIGVEYKARICEYYDFFEMENDLYYGVLYENYKKDVSYSYFELYKALKYDHKYCAVGNKIYCTDPENEQASFRKLYYHINKWVNRRTGYNAIFMLK